MVKSEENMSLKNPLTPPGIDPGTVRLVAQRLNHYATLGPLYFLVSEFNAEIRLTIPTCFDNSVAIFKDLRKNEYVIAIYKYRVYRKKMLKL